MFLSEPEMADELSLDGPDRPRLSRPAEAQLSVLIYIKVIKTRFRTGGGSFLIFFSEVAYEA